MVFFNDSNSDKSKNKVSVSSSHSLFELDKQEYELTDQDFNFLSNFIYKNVGIVLPNEKRAMMYARLTRRLRALKLDSFRAYCKLLEKDSAQEELPNLINAITTNLTRFFREDHHFEHLYTDVLGPCFGVGKQHETYSAFNNLNYKNESKSLRIWSAGCSTGEEPYSIAMLLCEVLPNIATRNITILASDVDTNVLNTAREGIYKNSNTIPEPYLSKYVDIKENGMIQIKPFVRKLVTFQQINLLSNWSMPESFDIIFCRNVVIYFDKETQMKIFNKMADSLHSNGWLYIGHSESLYKISDQFKLMGRTIYQKSE